MTIRNGYHQERILLAEKRKIWKTGKGTFVVSLPLEWAQMVNEKYKGEVYVSQFKEKVYVFPAAELTGLTGDLTVTCDDETKLESQIIAAYLANYGGLYIRFQENLGNVSRLEEKLREVSNKLYGTNLARISAREFFLSMSVAENPIDRVLDRIHFLCEEIYKESVDKMVSIPLSRKELSEKLVHIRNIEMDTDRTSFYSKRLLTYSLLNPESSKRIGIEDVRDVIEYYVIISNFERLSDLELELFEILVKLNDQVASTKTTLKLSLSSPGYGLKEYYEDAHKLLDKAYLGIKDEQSALEVLRSKNAVDKETNIEYRPGFISLENKKKLLDFIKSKPFSEWLILMEQRIWGMTGIGTNIAEAGRNIKYKPPPTREQPPFMI
jgi:phosphate uptake regulator